MRGLLVSFGLHAAGILGLIVLPSFSASELPPTTKRPEPPMRWPPVVRVHTVAPPVLPPRRREVGGGGGAVSAGREIPSAPTAAAVSDEPPRPEEIELPPGHGVGGGQLPGPGAPLPSTAVSEPPRLVRADVDVRPPRRIAGAHPVYPALARAVAAQATVVLECTIGADGRVRDVRVVKGHPLFDRAALDAVLGWTYAPTLLNGAPVSVLMTVTVEFRLNR